MALLYTEFPRFLCTLDKIEELLLLRLEYLQRIDDLNDTDGTHEMPVGEHEGAMPCWSLSTRDDVASHHLLKLAFVCCHMDLDWLMREETRWFQDKLFHADTAEIEDAIKSACLPFEICESIESTAPFGRSLCDEKSLEEEITPVKRPRLLQTSSSSNFKVPFSPFTPERDSPLSLIANPSQSPKVRSSFSTF